uniref:phosphotransferase family protein n=1 Tax=Clostridium sp. TaxID=1506 RepID=UPI002627A0EB
LQMANSFDIYNKIEKYEQLLIKVNGNNFEDYYEVKDKVIYLKIIINELDTELTPCHNDTVAENFIKSGDEKMYLIDWEYGGMNDPMWDLAGYCLENGLSEDEEELFLNIYFGGKAEESYKKRILINKIYQDFLWSTWTNIKEAKGDDFGSYGIDRYNRAKKNLNIILEENK